MATPSGCAKTRMSRHRSCAPCRTDPARARRTDPGDPEKCPVWDLHKIYSDEPTRQWVTEGCRTAGIGCLDCKKPLIEKIVEELSGMRRRAQEFEDQPELVRSIVTEGAEKAREAADRPWTRCAGPCICAQTDHAMEPETLQNRWRCRSPSSMASRSRTCQGSVYPAAGARGHSRGVFEGTARPAAVPDPPAEPGCVGYSAGGDHPVST